MLDFQDVLKLYDPKPLELRCKIVRHAGDPRFDLDVLAKRGWLEEYQARQGRRVFDGADVLFSFVGERGTRSRFLGAFAVEGVVVGEQPWPVGFPFPEMSPGELRYELRRIDSYDELVDRLVIDWRGRNWVQFMNSREVVEIRPRGFVRDFPGFDDVLLTFDELKRIVSAPDANHAWHDRLGAVAGVYLIVDTTSGDLYVGSASGANGIIGRWTSYATSAHGGNKLLKELLAKDASRHHAFTFSILRTLPLQTSKEEVFKAESFFKNKFGRKAISLNAN